ncbi:MAG: hypothetical protein ACRC62_17215 [Microcoleus sp.]
MTRYECDEKQLVHNNSSCAFQSVAIAEMVIILELSFKLRSFYRSMKERSYFEKKRAIVFGIKG